MLNQERKWTDRVSCDPIQAAVKQPCHIPLQHPGTKDVGVAMMMAVSPSAARA